MLSLLRQDSYSVLEGRLSEAVAKDPTLAPARSLLVLPLQLLDALACDAEAALGDDPLAAERMRVLLCAAGPHAIPASAAEALGDKPARAAAKKTRRATPRRSTRRACCTSARS